MNRLFIITLSKIVTLLGFFLGFSTKVAAQYGVWEAPYRYSGEVKSNICNEPVKGIKVTLEDEQKNVLSQTYTTEYGQFSVRYNAYFDNKTLYLRFTDVDGPDKNGSFLPFSSAVSSFDESKYNITLNHSGIPPCLKEEDKAAIEKTTGKSQGDLLKTELPIISEIEPLPIRTPAVTVSSENLVLPEADLSMTSMINPDNNEVSWIPEPIQDILVYPNPNKGSFTLSFTALEKGTASLSVYAPTGQLVYKTDMLTATGNQESRIKLPSVAKGTYILTLTQGKHIYTRHLVIK